MEVHPHQLRHQRRRPQPVAVRPDHRAAAGRTELTDAAKFLAVTQPEPSPYGAHKDWAEPFARWASESTANLHLAMLALAYVHGTTRVSDTATGPVTAWLDRLGYQPPAD